MPFKVMLIDREIARVETLPEATCLALEISNSKPFLERVRAACNEPNLSSELKKKRVAWFRLITLARKMGGFGSGIFVEQIINT